MMRNRSIRAFSYLEILIVIVILGLLATVVGVQYNQADTARGITKVRSDFAAMTIALENYNLDNNRYPDSTTSGSPIRYPGDGFGEGHILRQLTTPVAYLPELPTSPFVPTGRRFHTFASEIVGSHIYEGGGYVADSGSYHYLSFSEFGLSEFLSSFPFHGGDAKAWILQSPGPELVLYDSLNVVAYEKKIDDTINMIYDPTNGSMSEGTIWTASSRLEPTDDFFAAGQGLMLAIEASAGETWYTGSSWKLD